MTPAFDVIDLGQLGYAAAYELQVEHLERVLAARDAGEASRVGCVLLVEHDPPVITITRRPEAPSHLLASREVLARAGIEVHETDRGGDITYHGPGQLVVYPILDLNLLKLRLHDYMRLLENTVIAVCGHFGVPAARDVCATGVWVPGRKAGAEEQHREGARAGAEADGGPFAGSACEAAPPGSSKICAMGVRVRRWVSMHGLALNVTTNLDHFRLIVPCGLAGRGVTSLQHELRGRAAPPPMPEVKQVLVDELRRQLRMHVERVEQSEQQRADVERPATSESLSQSS